MHYWHEPRSKEGTVVVTSESGRIQACLRFNVDGYMPTKMADMKFNTILLMMVEAAVGFKQDMKYVHSPTPSNMRKRLRSWKWKS